MGVRMGRRQCTECRGLMQVRTHEARSDFFKRTRSRRKSDAPPQSGLAARKHGRSSEATSRAQFAPRPKFPNTTARGAGGDWVQSRRIWRGPDAPVRPARKWQTGQTECSSLIFVQPQPAFTVSTASEDLVLLVTVSLTVFGVPAVSSPRSSVGGSQRRTFDCAQPERSRGPRFVGNPSLLEVDFGPGRLPGEVPSKSHPFRRGARPCGLSSTACGPSGQRGSAHRACGR